MNGRRLDVTATQAIASMLATITGAVAASGLGIAGTMIGAAFMSLASTVGAAIYKHYLARSNERLRSAAANLAPHASGHAVTTAILRRHHAGEPDESAGDRQDPRDQRNRRADPPVGPDWVETVIMPALAGHHRSQQHSPGAPAGPDESASSQNAGQPARTRAFSPDPYEGTVSRGSGTAGHAAVGWWHRGQRRWLTTAALTLGIFVIVMGGVSAFEAIAGKPLETVLWHRPGSGTTIGGLVGGHSAHQHRESRPGSSPSPSSSPGSGSAQPSTTPPSSPSVSPTTSPSGSASPTPSAGPSSGPSTGTSPSPSPPTSSGP